MPKYTPLWISRWIVMGPRVWVWLLLIVGLVAVASFPIDGHLPAVWVWPDERSGGWTWPPSRVGRWAWRLSRVLQASSVCQACRVGLLASVITGSGLTIHSPAVWHLIWLPLGDWAVGVLGWMWPRLRVKPHFQDLRDLLHWAYQWSVLGLGLLGVHRGLQVGLSGVVLGSLVVCERDGSRVELEGQTGPEGQTTYRVHLVGEFVYAVTPRDEFEKRLVILDLRRLRTPGREGSPWGIVRQEDLAQVFDVFQEHISRWQTYVREGQWAQLLSVSDKSLLTDDLRQQIVDVWAANIWQTVIQVRECLAHQGVPVAERLVEEAGRQSGLMTIRARLKEQFIQGPDGLRPRDSYVTEQLFKVVEQMQTHIEQGAAALREETVAVTSLRQLAGVAEPAKTLEKPWPWLFQVEHWLFGQWQLVDDGSVHCPHCGSDQVAVKSKKPRLKAYRDEHGQRQTVRIYRYYCQNPDCLYQTFTHLPPHLIAYSVWTLDARLKALELYAGLRTNYRSAANALGVAPSTLYHWLEQFGAEPLQVAALFGLVRSSGVVGIDERSHNLERILIAFTA
jgi:transposase-like protein